MYPVPHVLDQEKNYRAYQKAKIHYEETQQVSEPDMVRMLKLSDWEFKITTIILRKTLMGKVNIYTRTDRRCKHVDENSKKKILMLKIKKCIYDNN